MALMQLHRHEGTGSGTGAQDFEAHSSEEFEVVNGVRVLPTQSPYTVTEDLLSQHFFYLDDLSLSDAQTVEHNVLGPGVIGHILRHRTWNTSTYAATDKWFGYDQVGSVLHETNSAGNLSTRHYQDAWGNVMQSYTTGLWNSGASGWHHNTKETDADAGLVYMAQRWFQPTSASFVSVAPYRPHVEHPYSFAMQEPASTIDPTGMISISGEAFFGLGGACLIEYDELTGKGLVTIRLGVGVGAGVSCDPNNNTVPSNSVCTGVFGNIGAGAGPFGFGLGGSGGISGDANADYLYGRNETGGSISLNPDWQLGASAAAGTEFGIPIQVGTPPINHVGQDAKWLTAKESCLKTSINGIEFLDCMRKKGF